MIPLKLSAVHPDFESLLLQLQIYLENVGVWQDLQTSGTGQTLLEMISSVATFNQYAVESGARETMLTTAVRDSSIYAITRMLGVRIHRKYPAGVDVTLTRQDSTATVSLPLYTTFYVNGKEFFNRNPLMFAQGSLNAAERLYYGPVKAFLTNNQVRLYLDKINIQNIKRNDTFKLLVNSGSDSGKIFNITYVGGNVGDDVFVLDSGVYFSNLTPDTRVSVLNPDVRLYEGVIKQEQFISDGTSFKQIYLSEKGFNISDLDVEVTVYDKSNEVLTLWEKLSDGIWTASTEDNAYYDSTSGLGETIVAFGDGYHGRVPKLGSVINIRYAVTTGSAANNGLTNLEVNCNSHPEIEGRTISVISGGADEKDAGYYSYMAPYIFKARRRGVTETDYQAVSLDYPGVISSSIMAQRDIAPYDLRWMNQVQICLLPRDSQSDVLTESEWNEYLNYMVEKRHAAVHIVQKNPTKQLALIEITLALKTQYIPSQVIPIVENNIRSLFKRRADTLGRIIPVSDITLASKIEGVDYVDINICRLSTDTLQVVDLIPNDSTHFIALDDLIINTKYSERGMYL